MGIVDAQQIQSADWYCCLINLFASWYCCQLSADLCHCQFLFSADWCHSQFIQFAGRYCISWFYLQIDTVVTQCSRVVQRINDLHSAYSTTLTKFKVACADAEVIPADTCHKASLEQCVYALKMSVADIGQLVVRCRADWFLVSHTTLVLFVSVCPLQAEEQSEGLVQLSIQEKMIPAGELSHALERFNQSVRLVTIYIDYSGL